MITNYFHCMNKNEFIAAPANQQTNKQNRNRDTRTHTYTYAAKQAYTYAHSNASELADSFANTTEESRWWMENSKQW